MSPAYLPLVHIGYHKTGTTWLQRRYFPLLRGVRMVGRDAVRDAFLIGSGLKFDPVRARGLLSCPGEGRPLITMEALSGYLHNAGYNGSLSKDLVERLKRTLHDAEIIVFIRRQPDVIAASYAQYVRAGGTHSVGRYLWPREHLSVRQYRPDKRPYFNVDHFDYLPLLRLYRRTFGEKRVFVYLYEHYRADPEGFLSRFESNHGLDGTDVPRTVDTVNPSYRAWLLQVARGLNRLTAHDVVDKRHWVHIPAWYRASRTLMEATTRLLPGGGTAPGRVLGARNVERLQSHYAEANRELMKELKLPLDRYHYPGT